MKTIVITGWKPGLRKVSLTETIQRYTGYGLAEAKRCTDDILENKRVIFKNLEPDVAEAFLRDICELGTIAEIQ